MGIKLTDILDLKQRAAFAAAAGLVSHVSTPMVTKSGPKLNKTEEAFRAILRARYSRPEYTIQAQAMRLIWGYKLGYLPDFVVTEKLSGRLQFAGTYPGDKKPISITIFEVKGGHIFEDGFVKFKTAARMFPQFTWILAQCKKGQWTETRYE